MRLDLALVLVEAILQDHERMVELDVHPSAKRTLLQFREDVSVQNCPVRMHSQGIQLIEVLLACAVVVLLGLGCSTGRDFG